MRCGRPGCARDHLDYHLLAANAQPLRRSASRPYATAGPVYYPTSDSTNQSLFHNFVERTNGSNDAPNELDDPLYRDAMLSVQVRLHRQKLRFRKQRGEWVVELMLNERGKLLEVGLRWDFWHL
ncbi:MAG TPA: hypothetical protein VLD17_14435 [Gemmatimonadaceae bacterium]|nr:hypothetical protein [Gemmatimonadaceae bacterium]